MNIVYEKIASIEIVDDCDNYDSYELSIEKNTAIRDGIIIESKNLKDDDSIIVNDSMIQIDDFYEEMSNHTEFVFTDDCVLNYDNGVYYGNVKKIIRHKVSKDKWLLVSKNGNHIVCTSDHSLMICRGNKLLKVKPSGVELADKIISIDKTTLEFYIDDIIECKCIGQFDDEYVYDIEMNDKNHTFFANNILVHNSAYVTLQPIIDACHIPQEQELDFDLAFYGEILEGYMDAKFEDYAKMHNCKKNLEKFELEKISRSILCLAKKNYMCDVAWLDSGEKCDPLTHVTYTGFDVVRGSTPPFVREELKKFTEFVLDKINSGTKPTQAEIVQKMREVKNRFAMQHPNDISKGSSISDYEKFVKNEKGKTIEFFTQGSTDSDRKLSVPIHVRAAAVYNNMLYTKAKKYLSKYSIIHSGDKVRFYYVNEDAVFGFVPDRFPAEFAPPMDIDIQFDKMLLSPMNRMVVALGYNEIPPTLTYTAGLF